MALFYSPSWLPTASAAWEAIEGAYVASTPEQWPKGLRFAGTALAKTREAFGIGYAWLAMQVDWWVSRYWPSEDDSAELGLPRWESILKLQPLGTIAERQQRVRAALRNRGTLNITRLQMMVSPAFDDCDLADIDVLCPDLSTVIADAPIADDPGWRDAFLAHIHVDGAHTLNESIGDAIVQRLEGLGFKVQIGEEKWLVDGMAINRGVVDEEP